MKYLLIALALVLFGISSQALAQTATPCNASQPWNAYCLQWTAPTTNVDGSAITLPLNYRIEQRVGTSGSWVQVVAGVTATRAYITNLAAGTYYFRVYSNCTGCTESVPSGLSPAVPITAPPIRPNPPTIVIAITISENSPPAAVLVNGSPVYASATP